MKVLIAGESWLAQDVHTKGFDSFITNNYDTGVKWLKEGLEANGIEVTHMPSHLVPTEFPLTMEGLSGYDAVILSDIGSNSFLLHPDTFLRSIRTPNRLKLLKSYVEGGGGLCMVGGYMTFQGIDGRGKWHGTAVEEVLPVQIRATDDRVETPEGVVPQVVQADHPVMAGIDAAEWPWFLGYNQLAAKPGAQLLLEVDGDAFLTVGEYGKGRTAAFASDCAPHWGPPEFVNWEHYPKFWSQLVWWLTRQA